MYINAELYEQIFNTKYDEESAFERISETFSITLDSKKSNNEFVGTGYADKQEDPMGISLSGNQGSGRAYFYGECFNIKGDKTTLATSPKEVYSNGKFSLAAAIKETIISNILSKELSISTFETLAILDTTDNFEFISEYLATNDTVKEERYTLPSVIEIRVNTDKKLYRVSNAFMNKEIFSFEQLKELSDKLALLEAEKFIKRFLHGSWSVGNISVNANLIDFDTSSFVKGRNPQFSNTNKYKSNYFGYEILGSKMILKLLYENGLDNQEYKFDELEKNIDYKYNEYLKIEFCKIIGLDYARDYLQHKSIIDDLIISNYSNSEYNEECNNELLFNDLLKMWKKLYYDKKSVDSISSKVLGDFISLFNNKNIKMVIMSQYKSNSYFLGKSNYMDEIVDESFNKIKQLTDTDDKIINKLLDFYPFGKEDERYNGKYLIDNTQNAKNWITYFFLQERP